MNLSHSHNLLHEWSNRENSHIRNRLSSFSIGRKGVGDDEFIEIACELDMRIIWKHPMWSKSTNTFCTTSPEHLRRFTYCTTRLDEIIDDDDIFSCWISFFDGYLSLIAFSSDFDTDDSILVLWETLRKSLCRTIIRECYHSISIEFEK